MSNDDRPSATPSWRSPAPPRPTPIQAIGDPPGVRDPTAVELDAPAIAPPMMLSTPKPAPGVARPADPVLEPAPTPEAEDPRALARRLGQEAKARAAASKPAVAADVPPTSALGRAPPPRKAAPLAAPAPAPRAAAPVDDRRFRDDDDDDGSDAAPPTLDDLPPLSDDDPLPPIKSQPLSQRQLPPPPAPSGRPLSAAEALKAALAAESAPSERPTRSARAEPPPPEAERPAQQPTQARTPSAARDPIATVQAAIPGATASSPVVVSRSEIFKALWRAHRARAQHGGDVQLAATASVLLDAVDRVPAGQLFAVRIGLAGKEWAGWVDVARGVLLGVAEPAEVYLAGL